jgi:hypothetical protein
MADLDLSLNGGNATISKAITLELTENLTVGVNFYDILTKEIVSPATLKIIWSGGNDSLQFISGLYRINLNTTLFGIGIHSITITTQSGNYSALSISFTLTVVPKSTSMTLFLQNENMTLVRSVDVEIGRVLNISSIYSILESDILINSATIVVQGIGVSPVNLNLFENRYQLLVNTSVFEIGVHYLTITASAPGFQPQSMVFTLKITPISTDLSLSLNGINSTISRAIEVPLRTIIAFDAVYYTNLDNIPISGANLRILLPDQSFSSFTQVGTSYSVALNVSSLGLGIHFITLLATKAGYVESSLVLMVTVIRIPTNVTTADFGNIVTIDVGLKSQLDIIIRNRLTDEYLVGATVQYNFQGNEVQMVDKDGTGHYTADITIKETGTYTIYITAYLGNEYRIEQFELTIVVIDPNAGKNNTAVVVVMAIVMGVVSAVVIAYMVYFKYPKMIRTIRRTRSNLRKSVVEPVKGLKSYQDLIKETHSKWTNALSKGKFNRIIDKAEQRYTTVQDVKLEDLAPDN